MATAGVMLFKGPQARRCTQKAVHTQGGTHKRRPVATAGVMQERALWPFPHTCRGCPCPYYRAPRWVPRIMVAAAMLHPPGPLHDLHAKALCTSHTVYASGAVYATAAPPSCPPSCGEAGGGVGWHLLHPVAGPC